MPDRHLCVCVYVCVWLLQHQGTNSLKNESASLFSRAISSIGHVFLLSFPLLQVADCTMKLWRLTALMAFPNSRPPLSLLYYPPKKLLFWLFSSKLCFIHSHSVTCSCNSNLIILAESFTMSDFAQRE